MIQTRTALCVIAAVASGLFLYSEKRQALMIDREVSGLLHATADLHTRTALLRAEWASTLGPDQLQTMVAGQPALQPIAPAQFVRLDDLGAHLPPPEAQAAFDVDDASAAPSAVAGSAGQGENPGAAQPTAMNMVPGALTAHVAPYRPAVASAASQPAALLPASPKYMLKPGVKRSPAQHSLTLVNAQDRRLLLPRPVAANTYRAMARPLRSGDPAATGASPGGQIPRATVASALGTGAALPPPVPYGQ